MKPSPLTFTFWLLAACFSVSQEALQAQQIDGAETQSDWPTNLAATGAEEDDPTSTSEASTSEESPNWFLMTALEQSRLGCFLQCHGIEVYGWTEGTYTASSATSNQLPMGFNYRADEFLLQQNWLRIERAADQDSNGPSFGFLADTILPGSDYRFTLARGLANGQSGTYGIDPVQFYAQVYYPNVGRGLDLKIGRFFGQYGVESIAAVDTPFVSRAYNFIYNPFTHTGLLTTLQLSDNWRVQNGIVTGSDVFLDPAAKATYIGSIRYESDDKKSSLLLATILGPGQFDLEENFANPQVFDLVFTRSLRENLTYKLDALYGFQENVPGVGTATWFAFVNYLSYDWNEQLQGNLRVECFDDSDGNRTGLKGLYTAITTGVAFRPVRSLIIRPEIRYDNNDSSDSFDGRSGLYTGAVDVIVRW